MSSLITCSHVDFGYENHDAVIDLTMEVEEGDYLCVVGANGSGKSTLVKGLLGLLKPTAGTLVVSEELKRTGIGYLPQQTAAQRDFPATVCEVVISGALSRRGNRPFYSAKEKNMAAAAMEKLGILDLKRRCYRELSGGQQQRVLIARALCAAKKLLILDEPVTGLDPSAIQEFYGLVKRLNSEEGMAVLMVTHDVANIMGQASRILHLQQRALFFGTPAEYGETQVGRRFLGGGL
ncbi:MAG: metal ABC transporter ATP-binding protein [Hungatella sp.]|nr:metal ABC transporter ATP-binding protein [Hungatella sp.]